MTAVSITRLICAVFFLVAIGFCVHLFLVKDVRLGVKVLWIAGIIFVIGLRPEGLPFLSRNISVLSFFRIAFLALFIVFLALSVFVVFWIQIPQERHPRFDGVVVQYMDVDGHPMPQVEYKNSSGEKIIFADRYASYLFPNRTFKEGERVSVLVIDPSSAHIDFSFLSRWGTAIFLMFMTALALMFSAICHLRIFLNSG
ncbi:hypothetical protein [Caballeronia sordidicola]|uniref:hypothetical protein n=1 Tax=Caballeronia sordidicola TaxID=196367 RepID=UPI000B785501|nr:hypothetical protein [Caballeronia sordidicola]